MFLQRIADAGLLPVAPGTYVLRALPNATRRVIASQVVLSVDASQLTTVNHLNWCLESIGAAFELPLDDVEIANRALDLYTAWLRGTNLPACTQNENDELLRLGRIMIEQTSLMFTARSSATRTAFAAHEAVCNRVLDLYRWLARETPSILSPANVNTLLRVVAGVCDGLLSSQRSSGLESTALGDALCLPAVHTFIEVYLRLAHDYQPLWEHVSQLARQWRHRLEVVAAFASAGVQVTRRIVHAMQSGLRGTPDIDLDVGFQKVTIVMDGKHASVQWLRVLYFMGDPLALRHPATFLLAITGVSQVVSAFLGVGASHDARGPCNQPVAPHSDELLHMFGGWLFRAAAESDLRLVEGRACAVATLCRLFGVVGSVPVVPSYLAQFAQVLAINLHPSAPVLCAAAVVYNLNAYALPRSFVVLLLPVIVHSMDLALAVGIPSVRRAALRVLASVVCLPRAYDEVPTTALPDVRPMLPVARAVPSSAGAASSAAATAPAMLVDDDLQQAMLAAALPSELAASPALRKFGSSSGIGAPADAAPRSKGQSIAGGAPRAAGASSTGASAGVPLVNPTLPLAFVANAFATPAADAIAQVEWPPAFAVAGRLQDVVERVLWRALSTERNDSNAAALLHLVCSTCFECIDSSASMAKNLLWRVMDSVVMDVSRSPVVVSEGLRTLSQLTDVAADLVQIDRGVCRVVVTKLADLVIRVVDALVRPSAGGSAAASTGVVSASGGASLGTGTASAGAVSFGIGGLSGGSSAPGVSSGAGAGASPLGLGSASVSSTGASASVSGGVLNSGSMSGASGGAGVGSGGGGVGAGSGSTSSPSTAGATMAFATQAQLIRVCQDALYTLFDWLVASPRDSLEGSVVRYSLSAVEMAYAGAVKQLQPTFAKSSAPVPPALAGPLSEAAQQIMMGIARLLDWFPTCRPELQSSLWAGSPLSASASVDVGDTVDADGMVSVNLRQSNDALLSAVCARDSRADAPVLLQSRTSHGLYSLRARLLRAGEATVVGTAQGAPLTADSARVVSGSALLVEDGDAALAGGPASVRCRMPTASASEHGELRDVLAECVEQRNRLDASDVPPLGTSSTNMPPISMTSRAHRFFLTLLETNRAELARAESALASDAAPTPAVAAAAPAATVDHRDAVAAAAVNSPLHADALGVAPAGGRSPSPLQQSGGGGSGVSPTPGSSTAGVPSPPQWATLTCTFVPACAPPPSPIPRGIGFPLPSRLLLCQVGLVSVAQCVVRKAVTPVRSDERFQRQLRHVDLQHDRECQKVGVLYVSLGDNNQYSIMQRDSASRQFHDFVCGMGWLLDLSAHPGFLGGLATDGSTGAVAPYYANHRSELIAHVPSLMPNMANDRQQIHKKRHVGNDHVHVVWTEHDREYAPSTVSSQFNFVHVVVSPVWDGCCRVRVHARRDEQHDFGEFGPLVDGQVVSFANSGRLARMTALSASIAVRSSQSMYLPPFPTRQRALAELFAKCNVVPCTLPELVAGHMFKA